MRGFSRGRRALREECEAGKRLLHYEVFARYDIDPPPEGRRLRGSAGISGCQRAGSRAISPGRAPFRAIVLDQLRALTATDEEFRAEARTILGVDPG